MNISSTFYNVKDKDVNLANGPWSNPSLLLIKLLFRRLQMRGQKKNPSLQNPSKVG